MDILNCSSSFFFSPEIACFLYPVSYHTKASKNEGSMFSTKVTRQLSTSAMKAFRRDV